MKYRQMVYDYIQSEKKKIEDKTEKYENHVERLIQKYNITDENEIKKLYKKYKIKNELKNNLDESENDTYEYQLIPGKYDDKSYMSNIFDIKKIKKLEGTTYVLEVVERLSPGKYKHVGYMQSKFTTIQDACQYYDKHNPHMRKLNALKTFKSDWDPDTKLFYIVREDCGSVNNIPSFS
jgi:hypothetical protein